MSKFRIHRSFEEELAKKAEGFTLQPRTSIWKGVDRGVQKAQSLKQFVRIGVIGTFAVIILTLAYFQGNKEVGVTTLEATRIEQPDQKLAQPFISAPSPDIGKAIEAPITQEKTPSFSHLRSIPSFEKPVGAFAATSGSMAEEISNEMTSTSLRAVQPKNIVLALALKESNQAKLKKRRRPAPINRRDAWYIQASVTPSSSFRSISARTTYAEPFKEQKNQYDQSVKTYSAKIALRYFFSDRFSIGLGLRFSQQGEIIGMAPRKDNDLYQALAKEYGYDIYKINSMGNESTYTNQYHYLEVPVTMYSKRPIGKRLSLHTGLGLSLGYLVKESSRTYDFRLDHYVPNQKFLRSWTVGAHAQVSLGYDINTRWMLSAGPELNYALLSTYQNYYTLSQHQYSFGLNLGVQWKLFDGTKTRGALLK